MTKRYYKYAETHRTVKGRRLKYCTSCKQWRSMSEFRVDRYKRDGLKIKCRDCDSAYERSRRTRRRTEVRVYLKFEQRHRIVNGRREKQCSKCGKWKKETEYHKQKSARDGLSGWCKGCSYTPVAESRK